MTILSVKKTTTKNSAEDIHPFCLQIFWTIQQVKFLDLYMILMHPCAFASVFYPLLNVQKKKKRNNHNTAN